MVRATVQVIVTGLFVGNVIFDQIYQLEAIYRPVYVIWAPI